MHVVATAGHVDHGKSTLVRRLTGADPDRLADEHRRGLSIQLGYCWTRLEGVGDVAFVDVPGHERFVPTMLSGVGPVPVVLFVVAADDPWMPQAAEHLAAVDALAVSHGVLVVTRADLADPHEARDRARAQLAGTTLAGVPDVVVSGRTGAGLDELRARLSEVLGGLPQPDPATDVRLWVDRCFTVTGAGTVVTGTLPSGTVRTGDTLAAATPRREGTTPLRVRGMESLDLPVERVQGAARVALNLVGADTAALDRDTVLVTPDAWWFTDHVDVRVTAAGGHGRELPRSPLLHVGATSCACRARVLGEDVVRLRCARPLPLRVGDRALLRDPGDRALWGVRVLDPAPPPLRRRGGAAARARSLAAQVAEADPAAEVSRRGPVPWSMLRRIGVSGPPDPRVRTLGQWAIGRDDAAARGERLVALVREHDRRDPLDPGVPVAEAVRVLDLPAPELLAALLGTGPLHLSGGRVRDGGTPELPAHVVRAVAAVRAGLAEAPFRAPDAGRLRELRLSPKELAAAARSGLLLRVSDSVVLAPGADRDAVRRLRSLPQPFTTSQARQALDTTRRVALPLLAYLDRAGATRRLADDRRELVG